MEIVYYLSNIKIIDSYKVDTKAEINSIIEDILNSDFCPIQVKERTKVSLYREWKDYNRLYKFNLFRTHTKDVDLGYEPWYRILCFFFLAW